MISKPFLVDCLINGIFYTKALIDTGCLCYSVLDKNLVRKYNLHTESVSPRKLTLADGKVTASITEMARVDLDIDGREENLIGYVMPELAYPIILGKPWMEYNNVVYTAKLGCLRIGSRKQGILVRSSGWYERDAPAKVQACVSHVSMRGVSTLTPIEFANTLKNSDSSEKVCIGAVTIRDITRALETKINPSPEDLMRSLPKEIREYTKLFQDDDANSNSCLPPHRPGVDTHVKLKMDDQGREKEVPWGPLYGMSRDELLVLRKTLTELLKKNWIAPSSSPGGAPVLFIKKPGGGLRFCADYRALNEITERDRYPLPLIRETLRMLAQAKYLSKVDVRSAFHRLRISKGDEWKTAFRTRFGAYEWLVTPFGLANAPAAFQRWINKELGNLLGETCAAYLDDIIIFSNGYKEDHWNKVREVLKRLDNAGLKFDPQKCQFAVKETKYLGYIINVEQGISADPKKIQAILTWEAPTSLKGVRSFLGFANFYRGFIKNFAHITDPLISLTKKGTLFRWGQEQDAAFINLKHSFSTAPILAMWQEDRDTVLETDASGWATG